MTHTHKSYTPNSALVLATIIFLVLSDGVTWANPRGAEPDAEPEAAAQQRSFRPPAQSQGTPNFLFGRPRWTIGAAVGWITASQSGEIFDFVREHLTIGENAFDMPSLRLLVGRGLGSRADLLLEFGYGTTSMMSEYNDFEGSDGLPIEQFSSLTQLPCSASLRFWLVPRGREVSCLAWIPNRIAPYVGFGVGTIWHRFEQYGEFVDVNDLSIFSAQLESSGLAASGHVMGGVSLKLNRFTFADIQMRFVRSNTPLSQDFVGFDNMDLNGSQVTAGIEWVF